MSRLWILRIELTRFTHVGNRTRANTLTTRLPSTLTLDTYHIKYSMFFAVNWFIVGPNQKWNTFSSVTMFKWINIPKIWIHNTPYIDINWTSWESELNTRRQMQCGTFHVALARWDVSDTWWNVVLRRAHRSQIRWRRVGGWVTAHNKLDSWEFLIKLQWCLTLKHGNITCGISDVWVIRYYYYHY